MLDQLREGDVVVVWKLDRLSRSLKDVLHIMERIGETGAGFRSITEAIDTTTPAEEARSGQAPRNRRKRHLRPLDRRRDGAALQHQRADRVTYRRHAPRGLAWKWAPLIRPRLLRAWTPRGPHRPGLCSLL